MVGVKPGAVVGLDDAEAILVEARKVGAGAVEMIKYSEFHGVSALCVS
jgi:hypothetical protein